MASVILYVISASSSSNALRASLQYEGRLIIAFIRALMRRFSV